MQLSSRFGQGYIQFNPLQICHSERIQTFQTSLTNELSELSHQFCTISLDQPGSAYAVHAVCPVCPVCPVHAQCMPSIHAVCSSLLRFSRISGSQDQFVPRYAPYSPDAKRVRLLYAGQVVKAHRCAKSCEDLRSPPFYESYSTSIQHHSKSRKGSRDFVHQ